MLITIALCAMAEKRGTLVLDYNRIFEEKVRRRLKLIMGSRVGGSGSFSRYSVFVVPSNKAHHYITLLIHMIVY